MLCEQLGTDIAEHRSLQTDQQRHGRPGAQTSGMHCTCMKKYMHFRHMCTVSRGDVTAATRFLTATNDVKGSCTASNMDIHDTNDDNEKNMRAGCVFHCRLCGLGELTSPPQRAQMHRIRISQNLQYKPASCMVTCTLPACIIYH